MALIDLDARAAVRAGPDGRDRGLEDKLHSGCDRMRMRGRQAASVCVCLCTPVCVCVCRCVCLSINACVLCVVTLFLWQAQPLL